MKDRKFLVTGSSCGIGHAICSTLLKQGHQVIGISRSPANDLNANSLFTHVQLDLSSNLQATSTIKSLLNTHNDISGLVNNAGSGMFGSLEEFSLKQIEASLQLNLISAIHLTRLMISTLKKQPRSDIIFMGSESALQGGRYGSVYSAAKFGLRGFAQALRHECARSNTHVGVINPGMVRSDFFQSLSFEPGDQKDNALEPEDVANAVLSLINCKDNAVIEEITLNPLKRVVKKRS
jgi:short-subunit dehydrogenase